jgi:F0F1-type ATP synthase epsilon subunit
MARTSFPVEVLTPEGVLFNEEIEMLSTRTTVGSIGIFANHEPVLAMLEPTELRLYRSESDIVRFAQDEGYLQFANNRALLLLKEATLLEGGAPRGWRSRPQAGEPGPSPSPVKRRPTSRAPLSQSDGTGS